MAWNGHLELAFHREGARTLSLDRHEGPLRVLQRLYPEGDAVCHQVLVHPPGGMVGGDALTVRMRLDADSHALLTTPGATRFYRSEGDWATQTVTAELHDGARLEWLPLETLAFPRCLGRNRLSFALAPRAQMMGWDVLALGLPAAGQSFEEGRFEQHLEWPGHWLERGLVDGRDHLLRHSPLGLAGRDVLATLWLAEGQALSRPRREELLELARARIDAAGPSVVAGVTAARDGLLVLRALGPMVEPVMALLQSVWGAWRECHWGLQPQPPRIWRT